jgi:predicted MFS family arabinose efflux permease
VWWLFIPVELAMGFGFYLLHGVMQARATELLPNARATAVSSFAFVLFLGQSVGALVLAALIARGGYLLAFLADAAAIIVFTIYLASVLRRPPQG